MSEQVWPLRLTVVPYVPTTQLSLNVTLWRVADTDANPLPAPEQIKTTKPTVVQDLVLAEAILTAVGPQKQGTYAARFICVVPATATPDTPAQLVLYGHGLLGKETEAKRYGLKKSDIEHAMRRLFATSAIAVEHYGAPCRGTTRLVTT